MEATVEQPHSVEISINAKQQMSGKVKIYAETPEDAMRIALEKAQELKGIIKANNEAL